MQGGLGWIEIKKNVMWCRVKQNKILQVKLDPSHRHSYLNGVFL